MFGCFGLVTPIQFPSFRRHGVRPSHELIDRQEKINIFQQANHPQLRTSTVKLIRFPWSLHVEAIFYPQPNYPTSSYKWGLQLQSTSVNLQFFLTHRCHLYTIWLFNIAMEKSPFLIGKPSINGPFSMAMLNNQRVHWTANTSNISRHKCGETGPPPGA